MRVPQQVVQHAERIATQAAAVIPPFAKRELEVAYRRALDRELRVVPRRPRPVHGRHRLALPVAVVLFLVPPAVAEVDAADEGDVGFRSSGMPDDDKLLVMGAAESHSLVEQHLASGRVDLFSEVTVLLGAEAEPIQV
jgi:hypothetical protein